MQQEPQRRVLVVDDDPTVTEVVSGYLRHAGLLVDNAADGLDALARVASGRPDLVILDLMLPGMDGIEVCRTLNRNPPAPAVIMLTGRGDEEERILGLEVGADDYVTKPFSPRELVLRAQSVLRRRAAAAVESAAGGRLAAGDLVVEPGGRRVVRAGEEIALTQREFDLLVYLMRNRGQAISRERLLQEVWGWEFGDLSTVTVHARRLRAKIEQDPANPLLIQTVWGVGYRFDDPERN